MEHEASTQKLDDLELVQYTMGFLDSNEFDPATLSSHQSSWADLKAFLIKEHGSQNVSLEQKVQLLKSVIKGPTENCQVCSLGAECRFLYCFVQKQKKVEGIM